MKNSENSENTKLNLSYLSLRNTIGILGLALPVILIVVNLIGHGKDAAVQSSISHYYYSSATVVFTGILISFGLLLISYHGYKPDQELGEKVSDNRWTNIAGVLAIIVALIPTTPNARVIYPLTPNTHHESILSIIHLGAAAGFFFVMGWIFIKKFTLLSDAGKAKRAEKDLKRDKFRQKIYRVCGYGIWAGLLFCLVVFRLEEKDILPQVLENFGILIGEVVMLIFLGTGWLVKGDALNEAIAGLVRKKQADKIPN